ncbi:MAG: LPS assembly lipoprotein LptE [Pseudomonadota bacterium]
MSSDPTKGRCANPSPAVPEPHTLPSAPGVGWGSTPPPPARPRSTPVRTLISEKSTFSDAYKRSHCGTAQKPTRRTLLLTATAALAACGFTPVYGPQGSAEGLRGSIAIDDPSDPAGFALVRQLERRLGLPNSPTYALSADLFVTEKELGITADQEITRFNILGRARFALRDLSTGAIATSGEVDSFTSYSATGTPFATQTAERDAQDRLMVILADQIVARLLATAGDWR